MGRQRLELHDGDLAVLAGALETDVESLRVALARRPWHLNDVLRQEEVVQTVLDGADPLTISPLLFFAVLIHRSADELAASEWVDDWVGPGCRLPVFDVEPLLEFTDAPGRLAFTTKLLVGFTSPPAGPVPADPLDLDDLAAWLDAVEPADRIVLLRQMGDLALFRAGVFADSTGASAMSTTQAEHLGRSAGMSDHELDHLVDGGSTTPGLDALEQLSSAWYHAAVEASPQAPVLLSDVANRIRAARRFLNYITDHYLFHVDRTWAIGA
ncbi:MAG: hypothetical protein ACR2O6_14045 [Ilumatobacteraceae bacterium]